MDFLSRLGLRPMSSSEGNHGELETILPLTIQTTTELDVAQMEVTPDCDTPKSAVDRLVFGANTFTSERIVVAKGFNITISIENRNIINLYMLRTRGTPLRVAQIYADIEVAPVHNKNGNLKGGVLTLYPGVHNLLPNDEGENLIEYHFLSRLTH